MLHSVRNALLEEARNSPTMLQDLAGLERYVAESYSARSFIELLQNADDAGADRVNFEVLNDSLICANNGRVFTERDLAALCRSASSTKRRGQGIGYRGIGFKSIVGVANTVHVLSGSLECTFSRELTKRALAIDHDVPLVRVPHELRLDDQQVRSRISELRLEGFETVFVLQGLRMDSIVDEVSQFDSDYLIFLTSVSSVTLRNKREKQFGVERMSIDDELLDLTISSPTGADRWVLLSRDSVTLAFSADEDGPVPLRAGHCAVHAFLPTLEQTGFLVRINADVSTDPSRTRVVLDGRTDELIQSTAGIISGIISSIFDDPSVKFAGGLLSSLTPSSDDVSLQFGRRSFASDLIAAVRSRISTLSEEFILPPEWINRVDAADLLPPMGKRLCPVVNGSNGDAARRLARFAGVGVMSVADVVSAVASGNTKWSLTSCADLVSHVASSVLSPGVTLGDAAAIAFEVDGDILTANDLLRGGSSRSSEFADLVASRGIDVMSLRRRLGLLDEADALEAKSAVAAGGLEPIVREVDPARPLLTERNLRGSGEGARAIDIEIPTSSNSSAWRSAELLVLELLTELGYQASDHSRQNLGYDILATSPGTRLFVEVKSLSYPGQPFSLTPNEDSLARDSGSAYVLALTYRASNAVYVQFIPDARKVLNYVKQCRQWAWECSEYDFVPTHEVRS